MNIEHIIYTVALAVIVGMIFSHYTCRDLSWIIIAVVFVPDINFALDWVQEWNWIDFPFEIHHGYFHNIHLVFVFSLLFATVLYYFGIRFIDGLI